MPAADTMTGVKFEIANTQVQKYRKDHTPYGVMYSPEAISNYANEIFPATVSRQPEKPEGFNWSIGFYACTKGNGYSFFAAPILVRTTEVGNEAADELPNVLDAFNPAHASFFDTAIEDGNGNPVFVYNEGGLWP